MKCRSKVQEKKMLFSLEKIKTKQTETPKS